MTAESCTETLMEGRAQTSSDSAQQRRVDFPGCCRREGSGHASPTPMFMEVVCIWGKAIIFKKTILDKCCLISFAFGSSCASVCGTALLCQTVPTPEALCAAPAFINPYSFHVEMNPWCPSISWGCHFLWTAGRGSWDVKKECISDCCLPEIALV